MITYLDRILGAIAAVGIVILLSGCASQSTPVTAPAPTITQSGDAGFDAAVLRSGMPEHALKGARDLAHAVCDALDTGSSPIDVVSAVVEASDSEETAHYAGIALGAAGPAYCPEHTDDLAAVLGSDR